MQHTARKRYARLASGLALLSALALSGCGHHETTAPLSSTIKPGVAVYPPNMRLGPDGKPIGNGAR